MWPLLEWYLILYGVPQYTDLSDCLRYMQLKVKGSLDVQVLNPTLVSSVVASKQWNEQVKEVSALFLYIFSSSWCSQCFEFVKYNLAFSVCVFSSTSKNSSYYILMIVNDFCTNIYTPGGNTLLAVTIKWNANCTNVQAPCCLYFTEDYFNRY